MKKLQLFICCIAILIFAGCSKKNKKSKKIEIQLPKDQLLKKEKLDYQQLLALHHEIPDTLLGFDVVYIRQDQIDKQGIEVVYKPIKNKAIIQQDIKKSYIADMEMLGWKMIGEFDSENIQLIFQKAGAKLLSTVIIQHDLYIKVIVCTKK